MSYGKDDRLDAHNLLGWYEKRRSEDGSGHFLLCRGLIFDAKDGSAAVAAWAAHNAMRITHVAPNACRSDRPWRFCVPEAISPFLSTFRAWLIPRLSHVPSTSTNNLFWDIVYCHDSFFTRIGLQESHSRGGDLRELMVWHLKRLYLQRPLQDDAFVVMMAEKRSKLLNCDAKEFRRVVKNAQPDVRKVCKMTRTMYGKYKWTRLRTLWFLRTRCLVMYRHLHEELRFRPGNAGALEAAASFRAAAVAQHGSV